LHLYEALTNTVASAPAPCFPSRRHTWHPELAVTPAGGSFMARRARHERLRVHHNAPPGHGKDCSTAEDLARPSAATKTISRRDAEKNRTETYSELCVPASPREIRSLWIPRLMLPLCKNLRRKARFEQVVIRENSALYVIPAKAGIHFFN
jgi:hypothetical protein